MRDGLIFPAVAGDGRDGRAVTVLHVDTDPAVLSDTRAALQSASSTFDVRTTRTTDDVSSAADGSGVDCLVCGYDLGGTTGLDLAKSLQSRGRDLPVVLFTHSENAHVASDAIAAGVSDFVWRDTPNAHRKLAATIEFVTDEHRSRRQLEGTNSWYQRLVTESTDAIVHLGSDGTIRFVTASVENLLGYEPEYFSGEEGFPDVHPSDRAAVEGLIEDVRAEQYDTDLLTFRHRRADGSWVWLEAHVRDCADDPAIGGVLLSLRDVTDHKRTRQQLNGLHSRTRELMRATTREGAAEIATQAAGDVLGLSVSGVYLLEESSGSLVNVAETDAASELVGDVPEFERGEGLVWEVFESGEVRRYDDVSRVEDRYNPDTPVRSELILPLGDHGVFLTGDEDAGVFDDRTESLVRILTASLEAALDRARNLERRTSREETVGALQRGLHDLVRADSRTEIAERGLAIATETLGLALSGIYFVDEAGETLEPVAVSDEVRDHLGELPPYRRSGSERSVDALNWRAFETNSTVVVEDVRERPELDVEETPTRSGIIHPLGDHGIFITSSPDPHAFDETDRDLAEILSSFLTATLDRVRREADLREQKRQLERQNERIETFTRAVSHDLRNPLNVAIVRLALVREECDSPHVEAVDNALDRMEDLVEDVLAAARAGQTVDEPEPVALDGLAKRCWATVETSAAELTVETEAVVRADPTRLAQVFENLFGNAVEHGGDGVTVSVETTDGTLVVEDDGSGIPPSDLPDVFDAGYSTSDDGTGFGLHIVRDIAEAHGWEVSVSESDSGGARFEISGVEFLDPDG